MWVTRALCFAAVVATLSVGIASEIQIKDANTLQLDFLWNLYNNTDGDMWVNNTNWLANDTVCEWYGVTCSGKWVQKLELKKNGLGGPLPDEWERLPYLDTLDLSSNKLIGTLPASIGNLTFQTLLLSGNSLRGTIPSSIGATNAKMLYLNLNQFTGTIPVSLAAMSSLEQLTLDSNKLTGSIPSALGDIGNHLLVVSAAYNSLVGTFPSGLCKADFCNFQYNSHLECPYDGCDCYLDLCNCGTSCRADEDCSDGICGTCAKNSYGLNTCGGK